LENESSAGAAQAKKARVAKTRTVGIRVTEPEYLALEREAYEHNQTVSDWGRNKILGASLPHDGSALSKNIFTELVGLQLLLMNALPPLLRGEHLLAEQVETLKRQVQAIKKTKAQELLTRRTEELHK